MESLPRALRAQHSPAMAYGALGNLAMVRGQVDAAAAAFASGLSVLRPSEADGRMKLLMGLHSLDESLREPEAAALAAAAATRREFFEASGREPPDTCPVRLSPPESVCVGRFPKRPDPPR